MRSDNAGCYHCAPLLLALPSISRATGIAIKRYDYSEPQRGKDVCDRKIAVMKTHIRQYVNEGHNVVSAKEMDEALDSHGGVKGCYSAVASVEAEDAARPSWPGIQGLYNFAYEETGIRVWKAYNMGPGKLESKDFTPDTATLKLDVSFGPKSDRQDQARPQKTSKEPHKPSETEEICKGFPCTEVNCTKEFTTYGGLQRHLDVGRHLLRTLEDSPPDYVKRKWAEACTALTSEHHTVPSASSSSSVSSCDVNIGWAIRASRKTSRFSVKVKAHLLQLFYDGEDTGHKADPNDVARHMRRNKTFIKEDWLTPQQIKSYFSRLASLLRAGRLAKPDTEVSNEESNVLDVEAEEAAASRYDLRRRIQAEVDI